MIFTKAITLALLTASASGFAPQVNQAKTLSSTTYAPSHQGPLHHNKNVPHTQLFMSDNTGDDFKEQLNKLQEQVDEKTQFLYLDVNRARNELANNWGWIVGSGVLTMALGAAALLLPVFATGVAYDATVFTIGATGIVNLLSVFAAENGHKVKSGLSGLAYGGLAYYMGTHPGVGLDIITLTIATAIVSEGFYETALAIKNKNIQGRGWHFVSGIISTLAGFWLTASLPAASLVTPGAALGMRLTSNGASKVAIGLTGKEIADSRRP